MSHQLLAIVGPTATGKTGLAVHLAGVFPSVLISADSRQLYRGLDVITGKDHPQEVELFGVDLLDPGQEASVAVWQSAVEPVLEQAWQNNKLPIVVGGTGLFVKALTVGIPTSVIPPNESLRKRLAKLSVQELQLKLQSVDHAKYDSLNQSDRANPRRLVRALEIAESATPLPQTPTRQSLKVGLQYSTLDLAKAAIQKRVQQRLAAGALTEAKSLLLSAASPQIRSSLGLNSLFNYLKGSLSLSELEESWVQEDFSYYKRQLTWFRKDPSIHWFDPLDSHTVSELETLAKDWYSKL